VLRADAYVRRSGAVVNVKDYGATGDGTTDDTTPIQRALDAAGATGGAVLLPVGVYRFSRPLGIQGDGTEMVGLGGSRLVTATLLDRLIDSNHFGRLRFHGLTIEGAGVQPVAGRGTIHLDEGSSECVVSACRIRNAPGTAIVDDGTRNEVRDTVIDGTGEHGIYSSGGVGSSYHGNHLRNVGRVAGTSLGCHGVSLAGSVSCTVAGNIVMDASGIGIALRDGTRRCDVRGNAVTAGTDRHIALGTASECTILGNQLRDAAAGVDAIRIDGGGGFVIAENMSRRATPGGAGIRWTTADVTGGDDVYGNTILLDGAGITQYGIDADSGSLVDVRIHGNTIRALHGAAAPGGVHVATGARVRVYGNRVHVGS
jgi:parallel beta-helix repeat protein